MDDEYDEIRKIYAALDDIETDPDPTNRLQRYIELRRELERFLIRTTGRL